MKVGDEKSASQIIMTSTSDDVERGRVVLRHVRCGRVVILRGDDGRWRVSEIEKPDAGVSQ